MVKGRRFKVQNILQVCQESRKEKFYVAGNDEVQLTMQYTLICLSTTQF